ncbi:2187_t:CDS:2 [Dentiscutata heterogama]|uniref:2187_t:CDS:1 n=1 Tax=Dentiscutata heterogama TaxID=1316150 RepID=A0ACA9L087_9GLOM|nr:2187_t:CDS:2 [Dentiscutata heterogama]
MAYEKLQEWKIILDKNANELDDIQLKIRNEFLKADEIIPTLSTTSQQHQDAIYTSYLINIIDSEQIQFVLNGLLT